MDPLLTLAVLGIQVIILALVIVGISSIKSQKKSTPARTGKRYVEVQHKAVQVVSQTLRPRTAGSATTQSNTENSSTASTSVIPSDSGQMLFLHTVLYPNTPSDPQEKHHSAPDHSHATQHESAITTDHSSSHNQPASSSGENQPASSPISNGDSCQSSSPDSPSSPIDSGSSSNGGGE